MIERQKRELRKTRAQDLHDVDYDYDETLEPEGGPVKGEDDSLDDRDLNYITAILDSLSKPKLNYKQSNAPGFQPFTPEGALTRAPAQTMTPPKFNKKFNQNSTNYNSKEDNLSYFSNLEEEGTTELADYFSDEEDNSLDNEDTQGDSDTWFPSNPDELGEISDKKDDILNDEDAWNAPRMAKFGLKLIKESDYEEVSETSNLTRVSSILNRTELAFSKWHPYIPPEPVFQNSFAPSWRLTFSQPASSSQELTLTQISAITDPVHNITKQTQAQRLAITPQQKMMPLQQHNWISSGPATRRYTHT
jgi:hypothetical protein